MLGEGLRAGLAHMGVSYRTICHVEREAYPAAVLVARMEEESLDEAPIWSDACTFDAQAWRGRVDCVVAGFPCQDLSVAGRRAGLDGKRSGLFFEVVRIATDSGAWLMVLENVAGIATATASVVDAEEGELDERAVSRVVGELADLGWNAEWITLPASDVGASHGRSRWFCLAWRLDDVSGPERWSRHVSESGQLEGHDARRRQAYGSARGAGKALGITDSPRWATAGGGSEINPRHEFESGCLGVADAYRSEWSSNTERPDSGADGRINPERHRAPMADSGCLDVRGLEPFAIGRRGDQAGDQAGDHASGTVVADSDCDGLGGGRRQGVHRSGEPRQHPEQSLAAMAHTGRTGPQIRAGGGWRL